MTARRKPEVQLLVEEEKLEKIKATVDPFLLSNDQVKQVMDTLYREMRQGLSKDPLEREMTSLQMENTYVRSLLDGTEEGEYLALDLGGTNFRVLSVRINEGKCESFIKKYDIPAPILSGSAEGLFDLIADSIHIFMKEHNLLGKHLPLGFTFSFPMIQESIKKGVLIMWTKSFSCQTGAGKDPVKMLEDAIHRRGDVPIDVVAILNDTTGTLMAGSYLDKRCEIGLIVGTGCNAAYVESLDNMDKWIGEKNNPNQVVINIEWGAFGDNGSLNFTKTKFDEIIDKCTNHTGSFTFEKLFAGHYVGDLVRLVLLDLAENDFIFSGHKCEKLNQWKAVTAAHVSDIERDTDHDLSNTKKFVNYLGVEKQATMGDISVIRYACAAVSIRGAQLISASVSVLLLHMNRPEMTVAIDGSLYKYHPKLHDSMMAWCAELAPQTKTQMMLTEDGSGRGAAFVAAVAVRSAC